MKNTMKTETPASHTPLPWFTEILSKHDAADYGSMPAVFAGKGAELRAVAKVFCRHGEKGCPSDDGFANAALIVRAVNNHAALVAFTEAVAPFLDDGTPDDCVSEWELGLRKQLRATLANAKS